MILSARNIENIPGFQSDLFGHLTSVGGVKVVIEVLEGIACDRVLKPALKQTPCLFAGDVQREDFMGIEMGWKRLMLIPGTVKIALNLAAKPVFQGAGRGDQPRSQGIDVIGDD